MSSTYADPTFNTPQLFKKSSLKNTKVQQFQKRCGECLLALEQYKLKTNFAGCNMNKEEFKKYYEYYESKPKKRLQLAAQKIQSLVKAFEKNAIYLQALQFKVLNNMMRNYRKRMNLMTNEPTNYSYNRFEKDQSDLIEAIISNDYKKIDDLNQLFNKIKAADEHAMETLEEDLEKNFEVKKKSNYIRAFKTINKAQVRYYRYFESFERSIANMINQIHAHMEKLNQFYTVWQNLGSSLIYEMKSDKQVLIDKTIQEKKNRAYSIYDETEDDMLQVIDVMPQYSKIRLYYIEKLQDLRNKGSRSINSMYGGISNTKGKSKSIKSNLKQSYQSITKVPWYQTQAEDIKQYASNDVMALKEREDGYFRYTYEQLHKETVEYLEEFKKKKIYNDFNGVRGDENFYDRFFVFCEKRDRGREERSNLQKIQKYNVPPQMRFSCWFDRLGPKGAFNVIDFPTNLVQRRIQFQIDRQNQLQNLDEKRRKQYNSKEIKLDFMEDQGSYNIGYKFLDSNKELDNLKMHMSYYYDPEYLPTPKDITEINSRQKGGNRYAKKYEEEDFSDSDIEQQEKKGTKGAKGKQKRKNEQMKENSSDESEESYDNAGDIQQLVMFPSKQQKIQKKQNEKNNIGSSKKESEDFLQRLERLQKHKSYQNSNEASIEKAIKQLKSNYPWMQTKRKQKQTLELFTQSYLPQIQKLAIQKLKKEIQRLGFTQEEIEKVSFKYLYSFEYDTLKNCIYQANLMNSNSLSPKQAKENINKIYLVNKLFFIKIDPLFFHSHKRIMKVYIFLTTQLLHFDKLKNNLESILSQYGKCTFQVNLDFFERTISAEDKLYGIIGSLLRDIRKERNIKNILEGNEGIFSTEERQKLINQGKRIYQEYENYSIELKKIKQSS